MQQFSQSFPNDTTPLQLKIVSAMFLSIVFSGQDAQSCELDIEQYLSKKVQKVDKFYNITKLFSEKVSDMSIDYKRRSQITNYFKCLVLFYQRQFQNNSQFQLLSLELEDFVIQLRELLIYNITFSEFTEVLRITKLIGAQKTSENQFIDSLTCQSVDGIQQRVNFSQKFMIKSLKTVIKSKENMEKWSQVQHLSANLAIIMGSFQQGIRFYDSSYANNKSNITAYQKCIIWLKLHQEWSDLKEFFLQMNLLKTCSAIEKNILSVLFNRAGETQQQAYRKYSEVVNTSSEQEKYQVGWVFYFSEGLRNLRNLNFEASAEAFQKQQLYIKQDFSTNLLINCYMKLGKYEKALNAIQKARPNIIRLIDKGYRIFVCFCYVSLKKYDQAMMIYNQIDKNHFMGTSLPLKITLMQICLNLNLLEIVQQQFKSFNLQQAKIAYQMRVQICIIMILSNEKINNLAEAEIFYEKACVFALQKKTLSQIFLRFCQGLFLINYGLQRKFMKYIDKIREKVEEIVSEAKMKGADLYKYVKFKTLDYNMPICIG